MSGFVANAALAPTGNPTRLNATDNENPVVVVNWVVKTPTCPWLTVCVNGVVVIVKSEVGLIVRKIEVVCVTLPELPESDNV